MEKIVRDFVVDYCLDWTYGVSISRVREDLDKLELLGATEINIEAYDSYGSTCVRIEAISRRPETEEEAAQRIEKEEAALKARRSRELAELKRLKEIYDR